MSWAIKWDFKWRLKLYKDEQFFNGNRNGVPCCRRAVAERVPTKISRHIWYMDKLLGWRTESSWWVVYLEIIAGVVVCRLFWCVGSGCVIWWPAYYGNSGVWMPRWVWHHIWTRSQNVGYWTTSTHDGEGTFALIVVVVVVTVLTAVAGVVVRRLFFLELGGTELMLSEHWKNTL